MRGRIEAVCVSGSELLPRPGRRPNRSSIDKRFAARGATGPYLRVLETGDVGAGDGVDVVWRPDHGITTGCCFRLLTTQKARLPELATALAHLPVKDEEKLGAKIARSAAQCIAGA